MKYIITTFLLILSYDASAQITLDSFKVYQTGPTLDSIYFRATSYNGQVLSKISATPSNDACGTVFGAIFFTGCNGSQPVTYDTTVVYNFFASRRGNIILVWDTSGVCTVPVSPTTIDTLKWDNCFTNSLQDTDAVNNLSVFPNPATDNVAVRLGKAEKEFTIELVTLKGKTLLLQKGRHAQNKSIDISNISVGLYFLKVQALTWWGIQMLEKR